MNWIIYERYINYLIYGAFAFFATLLITPWIGYIAEKYKILDMPPSLRKNNRPDKDRHLIKPPAAFLGGLGVYIPFLVITVVLWNKIPNIQWILIPTLILCIVGIIDDIYELSFSVQLFFQIVAAFIFILGPSYFNFVKLPGTDLVINLASLEYSFKILSIPLSISLPADLLVIIWILIITNALKLNGGTDSLVEGNSAITCMIIYLVSIRFSSQGSAILSVILGGSLIAYSYYNFYPGKIHSGGTGKPIYGFLIATISIFSGAKFAITMMSLALPIIDVIFVVFERLIKSKQKNIFLATMKYGDKLHFHHKLLAKGLSEIQVALIEYSIILISGLLVSFLTGLMKLVVLLLFPILIFILILWVTIKQNPKKDKDQTKESPEKKYSY